MKNTKNHRMRTSLTTAGIALIVIWVALGSSGCTNVDPAAREAYLKFLNNAAFTYYSSNK